MSAGPEQPALPPAPGLPESPAAETARYQPLSLLALASILLAGGLSTLLVVGAVIAVVTRTPLLLPAWLLLLAAAIIVLALIARAQIQNSEGTLSGLGATTWAIRLCLILAPIYGAYYAATYFSVTLQADDFAQRWLTLLNKGDVEEAYWWTVPAAQRPPKPQQTRDLLEIQHNQPTAQAEAPFSNFRRSELVRLLTSGAGKKPVIEYVTLNNWGFEQGGYQVQATYRITNDFGTFQVLVGAQGITATTGELRGRQWHIVERSCYRVQDVPVSFAPAARSFPQAVEQSRRALDEIIYWLGQRRIELAFDAGLSPAERQKQQLHQGPFLSLGLATGNLLFADTNLRNALAMRQRWFSGAVFDTDSARFWTAPGARAAILDGTRSTLLQGLTTSPGVPGARWTLLPRTQPTYTPVEGGDLLVGYDLQMVLPRPNPGDQPYLVEALAQVRLKNSPNGPVFDRLERIELITARTLPAGAPGPGGP